MVSAVGVFCIQECVYEIECKTYSDYSLTEAENVSVVMLAGKTSRENVRAASRAYTVKLVCRDGHTYSCAADEHSELTFARKYFFASRSGVYISEIAASPTVLS